MNDFWPVRPWNMMYDLEKWYFVAISELKAGVTVRKCPMRVKIVFFFFFFFLSRVTLKFWRKTLKHNRAPLLCYIKLCASFRSHRWIQSVVTVRKLLNWVFISMTLTFDFWPWPFAWTSLLSMVIIPGNFMMTRTYWKRCDRQPGRRKNGSAGRIDSFTDLLGDS